MKFETIEKERFSWKNYCNPEEYKIAINVKSLNEERTLFKLLNQHGCRLCSGEQYVSAKQSPFDWWGTDTCYSNNGKYNDADTFKKSNFTIYTFQEVLYCDRPLIERWFD